MAGGRYGAGMTETFHVGGPPPAPAVPPKRPRSRRLLYAGIAAVAVVAVGAAVAIGALVLRTDEITVNGTLVLAGSGIAYGRHTGICVGDGGYDDIHDGTQVVISDADGTTIAVGELGEGDPTAGNGRKPGTCTFAFSVSAPSGHDFYGVTIGRRGTMKYAADVLGKPLELSLG